jgi:uncharacterized protein
VYVRDGGIAHALLGIRDKEALLGPPVVRENWKSFVIETLIAATPDGTEAHYYRTSNGTEVDLVLTLPGGKLWAIEVKRRFKQPRNSRLLLKNGRPSRRLRNPRPNPRRDPQPRLSRNPRPFI